MVCLEKVLANPLLIQKLTGHTNSDFSKELRKYKTNNKKRSFHKILNSKDKQFFFIKFLEHIPMTDALIAKLLGVKDYKTVYNWRKQLKLNATSSKPKLKVLGEFLQLYPDIQEAIGTKEIHVPFQLSSTAVKEEHARLEKVLSTHDPRAATLMMFRAEIMNRNDDISLDSFILKKYNEKYGIELGEISLKDLAYLWGVSIEYMTRVLNVAMDKLDLDKDSIFERLILG